MAIKDLLWACPVCHRVEAIGLDGRCGSCGSRFARGRGARIVAITPDGQEEQQPAEWLAQLPWPDLDGEGQALPAGLRPPFRQRATARLSAGADPLRRGSDCLGFIERFGPVQEGILELTETTVGFMPAIGQGWSWALTDITAVSPASSAIQLKARAQPMVTLRFPEGSLRLWEQRLLFCVRQAFSRAGQGDITEFQPRIRTQ